MKKKVLTIILAIFICLGTVGGLLYLPSGEKDVPEVDNIYGNKYIDLVTIYQSDNAGTYVCYDRNTKVMYFIKSSGYKFGITPIYNADGSLKLYEEE